MRRVTCTHGLLFISRSHTPLLYKFVARPPVYRERYLSPDQVLMSREDRSPLIQMGRDFLTLWTEKGARLEVPRRRTVWALEFMDNVRRLP